MLAAFFSIAAAAAEDRRPLRHMRQIADRAGERRSDAADKNVAVFDVGQLVGQNAGELAFIEDASNPLRHGYRRMLRVTPGGESVRRLLRDHVHPGHRQTSPARQFSNYAVAAPDRRWRLISWAPYILRTILSLNQ